ncbi:MAG: menaquinone biosynthetic enzyme MqnA/MqnD family protein [Thermoanaerobaculia bacterium]
MGGPLRLGIVDYLNSWPLAWAFLTERYDAARIRPVYLPPAALADRLAAGELEAGLLPSIELQRIPGLAVVPGLAIAATHEAKSVLLVCRRPVVELRRVALDENSRTSAALVRIVLADGHGVHPELVTAAPALQSMLASADAALLIGDPALRVPRRGLLALDLAAEWRTLTGHPFVFAVWAVRQDVEAGGLAAALEASLLLAETELAAVVERGARELGLDRGAVHDYLTASLSYRLGERELAGLAEFHRRAHAHGLTAAPRPLRFVES